MLLSRSKTLRSKCRRFSWSTSDREPLADARTIRGLRFPETPTTSNSLEHELGGVNTDDVNHGI